MIDLWLGPGSIDWETGKHAKFQWNNRWCSYHLRRRGSYKHFFKCHTLTNSFIFSSVSHRSIINKLVLHLEWLFNFLNTVSIEIHRIRLTRRTLDRSSTLHHRPFDPIFSLSKINTDTFPRLWWFDSLTQLVVFSLTLSARLGLRTSSMTDRNEKEVSTLNSWSIREQEVLLQGRKKERRMREEGRNDNVN